MKRFVGVFSILGLAAAALAGPAMAAETVRVSVGPGGTQAGGASGSAISAGGRFVAFVSRAADLVVGDTNRRADVFVHDRRRGLTTRASLGPGDVQANGISGNPALSSDGRYVAFWSWATNLVRGDGNAQRDVFVRDRLKGTTVRASLGADGRQGNGGSFAPSISGDGRFVAFQSVAFNLVPGDGNRTDDVFVRDRRLGTTVRASQGTFGAEGNGPSTEPAISANGRFVAFASRASNFAGIDGNHDSDVFVRDLVAGTTELVSVGPGGVVGNGDSMRPAISADGRYVAFLSDATNLVPDDANGVLGTDVFVRDRLLGVTTRVNLGPGGVEADGGSVDRPAISGDGRFVAFDSYARNLVPGDANFQDDIFVRDRRLGTTTRASVGPGGVEGNGFSDTPAIASDGSVVAFVSGANNLVAGDTNDGWDVFVRVR
jgi:Tol biopolymer transport system component